uniref:acid phosphatase n=1 Tax=Acrobeloides nanus TaxID=290746 RepID=A0A914C302_9BILA
MRYGVMVIEALLSLFQMIQIKIILGLDLCNLCRLKTTHEIRSTDSDRTLVTAMTTMLGLYHNGVAGNDYPNVEGWPVGYVPIPIHTLPFGGDPLLWAYCERRKNISLLVWETPEFKTFWNRHHKFIEKLGNITGLKMTYEDDHEKSFMLFKIWDCLNSEKIAGLKLPQWAEENMKDLEAAMSEWMPLWGGQDIDIETEMARLSGGNLLWQIIDRMQKKADCFQNNASECDSYKNFKFYAFSAHDTTISIQFSTYGFKTINYKENSVPESSACILVELWKRDDNTFYVKVHYLRLGREIQDITNDIVGCENGCKLDEFKKRSLKYKLVPNREEACKVTLFPKTKIKHEDDFKLAAT